MSVMWNSDSVSSEQLAVSSVRLVVSRSFNRGALLRLFVVLLTAHCSLLTGCRRDMQDQPKSIAYRESTFYKDGISSRPLIEGTVPRGYLRADRQLYLGKRST